MRAPIGAGGRIRQGVAVTVHDHGWVQQDSATVSTSATAADELANPLYVVWPCPQHGAADAWAPRVQRREQPKICWGLGGLRLPVLPDT